jgi:hypothetical protein
MTNISALAGFKPWLYGLQPVTLLTQLSQVIPRHTDVITLSGHHTAACKGLKHSNGIAWYLPCPVTLQLLGLLAQSTDPQSNTLQMKHRLQQILKIPFAVMHALLKVKCLDSDAEVVFRQLCALKLDTPVFCEWHLRGLLVVCCCIQPESSNPSSMGTLCFAPLFPTSNNQTGAWLEHEATTSCISYDLS